MLQHVVSSLKKKVAALPYTAERPWYNIGLMQKIPPLRHSANEMFRSDINQDSTSAQVYLEIEKSKPIFCGRRNRLSDLDKPMCNYSYNLALPASVNPAALQGLTQDLYVWPCHLYVMFNTYSSLRRVSDAACHAPPQPHLNPPSLPEGPHLNKNVRNKFEHVWYSYLVAYGDQQNCLPSVGILFFSHLQIPSHVDGF